MTPTGIKGNASEIALARGAAYGFLAHAFRYPDSEHWSRFTERERWRAWPEILNHERPEVGDALRHLQEHFRSADPARSVSIDRAQAAFSRLFGHTVKGACPAYELEYGTGEVFQRSASLSDLQGFYAAFGLELQGRERSDHVSVECEFMSIIAAKEAYACQEQESEGQQRMRDAAGRFLEAHLGRWLPSLARRISEAEPEGFYGALGNFATRFIRSECQSYSVSAGPQLLDLRSADEDEETTQRCAVGDLGTGCPMNAGESGLPIHGQ
jgi:DMSO reductase family type II enzyme chaperone